MSDLEDRIRAAIRGYDIDADLFMIEPAEVLTALATIVGEVLALRPPGDAEVFIEDIRRQRGYWSRTDDIRAQGPSGGASARSI
jgi:hypothetical protein